MSAEGIYAYVDKFDFDRDAVLGVFDENLQLTGVAHLALDPERDAAELGISVLPEHRGQGIGTALFERAEAHARNHYIKILFMHCLTENQPMMHIASKSGMRVVAAGSGEADAHLELSPPDAVNIAGELMQERVALWDIAMKAQFYLPRKSHRRWREKHVELERAVGMHAGEIHVDAEKSK
jgi:hypothetical protein